METNALNKTTDDIRAGILKAARQRFQTYGYGKTTMAEIAEDVNMSAANLYRYFENKLEIAATCACGCMGESTEKLRAIVRQPGQSARQRLKMFVLGTLRHTQEETDNQPKINELVQTISQQRQDIVHDMLKERCALIAEVLAQGNETGEFDVADIISTSRAVYATLTIFTVPLFASLFTQKEFEDIAQQVVDLLINGLAKH